jgi:hypothetical protein
VRRLFRLVSWPSGRGVGEVACVWVVRVGSPAPGGVRAGKVEAAPRRRTGIPMVGRAALVWCALGRVMRCSVRVLPIFSGRVSSPRNEPRRFVRPMWSGGISEVTSHTR